MSAPLRMRLRTRVAAIVGVAVFLVLASTGVGYAYWTTSSAVTASAASTNAGVALDEVPAALGVTYTSTSTGPAFGALTLRNSGGAPLTVALAATGVPSAPGSLLPANISLTYWPRTIADCTAAGLTTATSAGAVTTGTLAAPPALPSAATSIAAGGGVVVCAATSLTDAYATYAGQSIAVTLTLTGTVGTWTATASRAFTQTVQSAPVVSSIVCTTSGQDAKLSWTAPSGWTNYPQGHYVVTGSTVLSDQNMYMPLHTQDVRPDKFIAAGLPTGVYTVEVWAVQNAGAPFTKTGSVLVGTVKVEFYPTGWFAVRCA